MAPYLQNRAVKDSQGADMDVNFTNLKHALINQMHLYDSVSNNLANINTKGYKKDVVFFDALSEEMDQNTNQNQSVDLSQGNLTETSNPLDLAISGRGFFTVENDKGLWYTRDGHFKLDADNILRTSGGDAVLGEGGWITLIGDNLNPADITITKGGEIYVDDMYVDRLLIQDFENSGDLEKVGANLYQADPAALPQKAELVEINQGFLEESNVNPADEMIQLIEIQRQFESIQKMVRSLDDVLRAAANRVGKY